MIHQLIKDILLLKDVIEKQDLKGTFPRLVIFMLNHGALP